MGIVGERPESGVRITVQMVVGPRASFPEGVPPGVSVYEGAAVTATSEHALRATIDPAGEVSVEVADGAPPDLAEKVRLILRTVVRESDGALPHKVSRWRPAI